MKKAIGLICWIILIISIFIVGSIICGLGMDNIKIYVAAFMTAQTLVLICKNVFLSWIYVLVYLVGVAICISNVFLISAVIQSYCKEAKETKEESESDTYNDEYYEV